MTNSAASVDTSADWTFFSNHSHVLVCVGKDPEIRLRDIAIEVGITERSAQRIINHLRDAGILVARKNGRRNQYLINVDEPLRHPLESDSTVGEMLGAVLEPNAISQLRRAFQTDAKVPLHTTS